jgi:amino acid adenylation domain-containing protein
VTNGPEVPVAYPHAKWQHGSSLSVPDLCIHQLFDVQVHRDPDAIAVVFGDRQLTYREFDAQTNQLAHRLAELGVGPESIVVVCLPRSIELVAALLAIVKAGGAYLPIDPDWPAARKRLVLDELGTQPVAITDPTSAVELADDIRLVDPRDPALGGYPTDNRDWADHHTNQLAYVSFTSGSTGRPKGVMIEHRGVQRLLDPYAPWRMGPGDRILHLAPAAFDATTLEVWLPLLSGATLVVAPAGLLSLGELARQLREQRISTLFLTTGLFNAIADAELSALAGVRQLMTGGEVLDRDSMQAVLDAMPAGHTLVAVYGPTESTTFATYLPFASGSLLADRPIPIGRPLAATTAQVLDSSGGPCPVGVPGELHIGGQGLARGYLNNPELTAEKFIGDPHAPCDRLYRTGDLASWNSDGTLAFHGRVDQQVKVNGIRIEPGETEAAMREHPAVSRALVVLLRRDPDQPRLVAYWVRRLGTQSTPDLRAFLEDRLPGPMIPAAVVEIDQLPLNANGKVDCDALPAPKFGAGERLYPRSSHEHQLSHIWAEVLGHSDFGVTDNFFGVGGNSLSSVRLQARFEDEFKRPLPLPLLFALPTLREQAEWLTARVRGLQPVDHEAPNLVTLEPLGDRPPLFVVHGWDGKLFDLIGLAREPGLERPVFGLQSTNGDPAPRTDCGVRAMAADYADQILKRRPQGPIHLYGYSIGGWHAFAVAEALIERGAEVGLLLVGDTQAGDARVDLRLRLALLPGRLSRKLSAYVRHPPYRSTQKAIDRDEADAGNVEQSVFRPRPLDVTAHVLGIPPNISLLRRTWRFYALAGVSCEPLFEDHSDFVRRDLAPRLALALQRALDSYEGVRIRE